MTWGLVAWAWDRKIDDADAAHILGMASELHNLAPQLSWIVPHEVGPGEFVSEPLGEEAILKYGIGRTELPYDRGFVKTAMLLTPQDDLNLLNCSLSLLYYDNPQSGNVTALRLFLDGERSREIVRAEFFRESMRHFIKIFNPDCSHVASPADPLEPTGKRTPRVGPITYIREIPQIKLRTASVLSLQDGAIIETKENLIQPDPPSSTATVLRSVRDELIEQQALRPVPARAVRS
jgi:hypothetical protein